METYKKNWFKFIAGFVVCFLIRLIPGRPPNIEPILGAQMPFSKAYGGGAGFVFAFLSVVLFDILVGKFGPWTFFTAVIYGILGIWALYFFKKRENSTKNYFYFAIIGTIFFDAITGLSIGPLFFHQPFMEALIGQVPFTGIHLIGNTFFAITLSPALYRYVLLNKKFESDSLFKIFKLKTIPH